MGLKERLDTSALLGGLHPEMFSENDNNTLYQGCMNSVSPQGCDQLAKDGPSGLRRADCLFLKDLAATAWATFKQNDASACARLMHFPYDEEQGKRIPKSNAALCEAFAPALKSGRAEILVEQGILPKSDPAALNNVTFLRGQPELCAKAEPYERAVCRAEASLLRALRSGDPAACAASPLCKALASRREQDCAPYLAAANKSFCASIARLKAAEGSRFAKEKAAEDARLAKEKAAGAASLAQVTAQAMESVTTKKPVDPATAALQAKAAKEAATAREAALKKSAAELDMRKRVLDEKIRRAEARREKKEPPRQFRRGEKLQDIPPDVKKKMDEVQRKSQPAQPAGTQTPVPQTPTQ
ncbi:MAG: hypothetical protein NTY77_14635 [Elusimicrobia bacterium]|nr:hypothetical protein [Elusimicrobiota bacterium]